MNELPEYNVYVHNREPQMGMCEVKAINFESRKVILSNGRIRVTLNIDDYDMDFLPFTGFVVQDGVKIFKGDIVRAPSDACFEVIWSSACMGWKLRGKTGGIFNFNAPLYTKVSNIFENSELL